MKNLVDLLREEGIVCKKLERYPLDTKKRVRAFLGVNLKDEYCFVLEVEKKSRILRKDIEFFKTLLPDINFRYKRVILVLNGPICSKAKEMIKEWRILWY